MRKAAEPLSRSRTPRLYETWRSMKRRCEQPSHTFYKYYGAKGVSVCEEWHDFSTFAHWAVENGYDINAPKGKCTLDRIDTDGNYEPSNCRWVDMKVQNNNKPSNLVITFEGKTMTAAEWRDELGLSKRQLWRLYHYKKVGKPLDEYLWQMKYNRKEFEIYIEQFNHRTPKTCEA